MRRYITGLFFAATIAGGACAQEAYPNRTVKIIVPSPPGGVTDTLARVLGQSLAQMWGQNVIVENRPGADEIIGADAVVRASPDGYTLLVTSNGAITAAPHMHKQMRYDPLRDFTPLVMMAQVTPMFNVSAKLPVTTMAEFLAYTKANPGKLNYGSMGNGTYAHVAMEDFKQRTGVSITHIPYKGATPAVTALLQDEIAVMIVNLNTVAEHEKVGKVRVLASAGPQRASMRPELPTVAEAGVPGFSTGSWWGIFGPANLPADVTAKLRASVNAALETPQTQRYFEGNTLERIKMTPEEFTAFMRADLDNWGRQFKAAGIEPD